MSPSTPTKIYCLNLSLNDLKIAVSVWCRNNSIPMFRQDTTHTIPIKHFFLKCTVLRKRLLNVLPFKSTDGSVYLQLSITFIKYSKRHCLKNSYRTTPLGFLGISFRYLDGVLESFLQTVRNKEFLNHVSLYYLHFTKINSCRETYSIRFKNDPSTRPYQFTKVIQKVTKMTLNKLPLPFNHICRNK